MKNARKFLLNALLLTATSLLMRTVGISFNVYLSAKIGTAGMGLYQLILSVYMLCVTLSVSGIQLSSTRLTAQALASKRPCDIKSIMRKCLTYSCLFGTATACALFFFADFVGLNWLGDSRTIPSLRLLALSMPFLSMSSAMNGYFTAVRRVYKSAAVQVFEQASRIMLTIIGLTLMLPKGIDYACAAIIAGGTLSELLSFLVCYLCYKFDCARVCKKDHRPAEKGFWRKILSISLPVAFSAYARSGLVTAEHLLIPRGLRKSGVSSEAALATYGMIQGMVLPILLFPAALLTSFAGLIVPELTERMAKGKQKEISEIAARVFRLTLLFAFAVAGILYFFSDEFSLFLYKNTDSAAFLHILAPLIPVMYLDTAVDGMLKGLGEQVASMRYNIIDASVSVLLVYFLVPIMAIKGYLVTIYVTEMLNAFLSACRLVKVTRISLSPFTAILFPLLCIWGACSAANLLFSGFSISTWALWAMVICSLGFYFILCRVSGALCNADTRFLKSLFSSKS